MGKEEYKCPECDVSIWNKNEFINHAKKKHGLRIRKANEHLVKNGGLNKDIVPQQV